MKFNTHNPFNSKPSATTPEAAAATLRRRYAETLEAVHAVLHHPRSLSRPTASWRPPVVKLPRTDFGPQLTAAVTRRRVGPRAKARIQGYGESQVPAYLVEIRFADTSGVPVDTQLTEAWVRAVVPEGHSHAVHELPAARAVSYVWLVDGTFTPIASPPSMFEGLTAA